jgi:hypothetical protein
MGTNALSFEYNLLSHPEINMSNEMLIIYYNTENTNSVSHFAKIYQLSCSSYQHRLSLSYPPHPPKTKNMIPLQRETEVKVTLAWYSRTIIIGMFWVTAPTNWTTLGCRTFSNSVSSCLKIFLSNFRNGQNLVPWFSSKL